MRPTMLLALAARTLSGHSLLRAECEAECGSPQAAPRHHDRQRSVPRLSTILAAAAALIGLVLIGQGLWIHAKALLAQILLERAFEQTLASGHDVKPWSWADTWPVARLEIPRLGRGTIVLAGSSGQALAFGPGHVEGTPQPGERGTTVYSAHRDTHFSFLADVKAGDVIRVTRRDGAVVSFRITHTSIVRWDASGIDPFAAGHHLVLSTCWPLDAATASPLRYLVHADLVAEPAARGR
jgi:sortase A